MKIIGLSVLVVVILGLPSWASPSELVGAWKNENAGVTTVRIYADSFFSVAVYKSSEFIATYGGSYKISGGEIAEKIEFDTQRPERIGLEVKMKIPKGKTDEELELTIGNDKIKYVRLDAGTPGKLEGAWLITGRYSNGAMKKNTPGARRTMKILSGTRFQWIAYNVDTKEFFGTGGGKYTTEDGKYTEEIQFFSRDHSRAGKSLEFNFSLTDAGDWRHTGKSSKGDSIDEIWTKRQKLGI